MYPGGVAPLAVEGAGGYTSFALPAGRVSDDGSALHAARAKRVWFRLPDRLEAAHYVEVQVRDGAWPHPVDYYAYVVSAADGALLFRHDQTADAAFTYRVYAEAGSPFLPLPGPHGRAMFPHPTGTPDGAQPPFAPGNLVTLANAPFSRNDPWLADTANRTHGNNVEAHTNMATPDGFGTPGTDECNTALPVDGDLHACVSAPQTFDYAYDHAQAPDANRTQVAAAGLKHPGGLSQLQTLDLAYTKVTDAGLVDLKGLTQLRGLNLQSTPVTDAGVGELKKALPNCRIHR